MNGVNSEMPQAWVVRCKKCSCTITCRAIDPQTEHSEPDKAEPPPSYAVVVACSCCWSAFRYASTEVFKGQPAPSNTCPERRSREANNKEEKKPNTALLVAASLIAAVRLHKEEVKSSPSVQSKIADSIRLAEMIQSRLQR